MHSNCEGWGLGVWGLGFGFWGLGFGGRELGAGGWGVDLKWRDAAEDNLVRFPGQKNLDLGLHTPDHVLANDVS